MDTLFYPIVHENLKKKRKKVNVKFMSSPLSF